MMASEPPAMRGAKFDRDKIRLDLIPTSAIWGLGRAFTYGAAKYGAKNWELGIEKWRLYSALLRHLTAFWAGQAIDESGLHHLDHALANLAMLHAEEMRMSENHEISFCPCCGGRIFTNTPHFCSNPAIKKSSGFSFGFKINLTNLWARGKKGQ